MAWHGLPLPSDGTFVNGVHTATTGTEAENTLASAVLSEYIAKKSFDNVSRSLFFLSWLTKAKDQKRYLSDGGHTITVPLNYALDGAFRGMTKWDEVDTTITDTVQNAIYSKRLVAGPIRLNTIDLAANQGNQGHMLDLLMEATDVAERSLADQVGQQIAGGAALDADNIRAIGGLRHLLRLTAPWNEVGGIDRATAAGVFYRNRAVQIADFSTEAAAGFPVLTAAMRQCSLGASRPELLLCAPTTYDHFHAEFVNRVAISTVDATMANLGFNTITWQGVTVGYDDYIAPETGASGYGAGADVGVLYILNSDALRFYVQKGFDFEMTHPLQDVPLQFVKMSKLAVYGNLVVTNMQRLGAVAIEAW